MEVRFVVDGMLGSLARKLRIYGFDVLYISNTDDLKLIELGKSEGRIVLTSDRALFKIALKNRVESVLLTGNTDEDRIVTLFRRLSLDRRRLRPEATRCPQCNGILRQVGREEVRGRIPENIVERHEEFFLCESCDKEYWQGSHWLRIEEFTKAVRRRLERL